MHQWGVGCNRELHGTSPSSGLFAVLLALATCKPPISLYGFWPFCCRRSVAGQPINYKYHQGNRTRWVCCSRGRERMEVEFEFYQKLARQNLVRLRQAVWRFDERRHATPLSGQGLAPYTNDVQKHAKGTQGHAILVSYFSSCLSNASLTALPVIHV